MVDPITLLAFVPAVLLLNVSPGPDMVFCLGQGLRSGPRAGVAASAGISTGSMVHVTIAGLGLGAVVAAYPVAFDVARWLGVIYLLWLAFNAFRAGLVSPEDVPPVRPTRAFRDGMIVNLTNPKVILFVLALIPQFLDPARPVLAQFLIFGSVLAICGFFVNAAVGVFAGGIGRHLTGSPRFARATGYVTGTLFAALAVRMAMLERV
jgi:threonine/homoserine/homoserine lactone efflux protein